ncbi:uncharacterized protein LODBEIA_P20250 [Lodderomyces beijingensis]|uniref:CNH domain-containing protein n=1 Tax=Lodderomyces beijingensis TaxID=1775926 RepID=A0ABP0ZLP0_9ASCO
MSSYQIDPLLDDIPLKDDRIVSVETNECSVYIGTAKGNLLQYYLFDDASSYLLITQISIKPKPITALVCLAKLGKLFAICDGTVEVYSLPDLSPFSTNSKLTGARGMSATTSGGGGGGDGNSLLVFKKDHIEFVQLRNDQWVVQKQVRFPNVRSSNAPVQDLLLVADDQSYAIISDNVPTPLFSFGDGVPPHIESFETPEREYLMTISTDEKTSMAMFINSVGDVTRGTLTWIGHGYPYGGVAVSWPHAFAVFKNTLVMSSLETLENEVVMSLEEFTTTRQLENTNDVVTEKDGHSSGKKFVVVSRKPVRFDDASMSNLTGTVALRMCNILLFSESKVYALHRTSPVLKLHNEFENALNSDKFDTVLNFSNDSDYAHLVLLLASFLSEKDPLPLLTKRRDGALVVDPNLAARLLGESSIPYTVFPGLRDIIDTWDFSDESLLKKYLSQLLPSDTSPEIRKLFYQLTAEEGEEDEKDLVRFLNKDTWTYSEDDREILNVLIERSKLQLASKAFTLMSSIPDATVAYKTFLLEHLNEALVDDAIAFLGEEKIDEKDYSKIVLSMIKLDKEKVFNFIRSSNKYLEINRKILSELPDSNVNLIQIELLEKLWQKDDALHGDLFEAISTTLISQYDADKFAELLEEYRKVNSLTVDKWPKIFWIDYLSFKNSEFIALYRKSFELYVSGRGEMTAPDHVLFHYHKIFKEGNIKELLEFRDYSTAERISFTSGEPVTPANRFYPQLTPFLQQKPVDQLILVLKEYLRWYEYESESESESVEPALQHFVDSYGKHFSPVELVTLLPDSIPIAYLESYLKRALKQVTMDNRDKAATKNVLKAHLSSTHQLIHDLL